MFRHFMPEGMARFLLKRRWIIRPGLESRDPLAAVEEYIEGLAAYGKSIQGKRILVFGYGGRFAVGVELLKRGASHVVLCDHFVLLDSERNRELLSIYSKYLLNEGEAIQPRPEYITLVHGDIREAGVQAQVQAVDLVLSTSVYEHLDDVDGITHALSVLTSTDGVHLHFVDLRDHYFKYPFEMLKYSDRTWRSLLNPTSNLNRLRLGDYRSIFQKYFDSVDIFVIGREQDRFQEALPDIRQEFLTGDPSVDSVTLIRVFSSSVRPAS
jgi:hypothetical protein